MTLGSKEGLANLAQAITAPGDIDPGAQPELPDPPLRLHHRRRRRSATCPCRADRMPNSCAALERAVQHSVPQPLALVLNFPSNPTAQVVDLDFYREIVEFCATPRHLDPVRPRLCRDLFRRQPPPSILEVPGAFDVAVEFTSLCKTYSMPAGASASPPATDADRGADPDQVLPRLRRLHADPGGGDGGAQRPAGLRRRGARHLQRAPRRAGRRPARGRLGGAGAAGHHVRLGADPEAFAELGSLAFSKLLLTQAKVAVSPGIGFGEYGEGYVRLALVENQQRIRQAVRNIRDFFPIPAAPSTSICAASATTSR